VRRKGPEFGVFSKLSPKSVVFSKLSPKSQNQSPKSNCHQNLFHDVAGELRYQQVSGNTYVYGDTTGDGIADFMIKVDGSYAFAVSDFGL
jgi:hypothetical protein